MYQVKVRPKPREKRKGNFVDEVFEMTYIINLQYFFQCFGGRGQESWSDGVERVHDGADHEAGDGDGDGDSDQGRESGASGAHYKCSRSPHSESFLNNLLFIFNFI